jgi:hypothetical protein
MLRATTTTLIALSWVMSLDLATAQDIGPPIPPSEVLRQQNQPMAPPPSVPVPARPPSTATPSAPPTSSAPPATAGRDRTTWCQHQAAVERVPRGERGAYIQHCVSR